MTHSEIVQRVNAALLREFDVSEEALKPDAHLIDDLGLDSLDGIDLVVALEKEFKANGIKIKEEHARTLTTLQAIYTFIESHQEAAA
jgi:acyl carrier protein